MHCTKEYFEELLRSASRNLVMEFTREEAAKLIRQYFPIQEYMSKSEVAAYLGCSLRQIDYLRENHGLPWFSQGNAVRFSVRDIQEWIEERKHAGSGSVPCMAYKKKNG